MSSNGPVVLAFWACALAGMAAAETPLSSIDWLSDSVTKPAVAPPGPEPEITTNALPEEISVKPLDAPRLDSVGLLAPAVTGLPETLWAGSDPRELARLIRAARADTLPAVQSLLYTLMLAELDPPEGEAKDGTVLLARLDKLLDLGALDQAQALIERAGPANPALFRRWFDVALLTGHEDRACVAMLAAPGIAPTFSARIFCLARGNDWNAAVLTLETAKALGYVSPEEDALLARFLELDQPEDGALPSPPRPSPLVFRMMEAIGEPLSTPTLPRAFAQADLQFSAGWKAKIEATERLVATGALPPNRLLGIYTERKPAASGGVWDRVAAVQRFDVAMLSGDADRIAATLPRVWSEMQDMGLEVPFARLYGEQLMRIDLDARTRKLGFRIGLLSDGYETIAARSDPDTTAGMFLKGLAQGAVADQTALGPTALAVKEAFVDAPATLGPAMTAYLRNGQLGEALLHAIDLISEGARGDVADVTEGLALLRHVGLEDVARRAALELLILRPRG